MGPHKGPIDFPSYLAVMNEKIEAFKQGFHGIVELCNDIDSTSFQYSVSAILEEVDDLTDDSEMEKALSLLDELVIHLNDLDDEFLEPYGDTIEEINNMAEELIDEAGSA
jgi:hypothetical protein